MWHLSDVLSVIQGLKNTTLEAVYRDDFKKINTGHEEPNLAYIVLKKQD
jgi:hypothetical protein